MRSSWDETWLNVAKAMAGRSKCVNRQVGAVIVDPNNRPVSVGYNGEPAGLQTSGGCDSYCPRGSTGAVRDFSYANCVSVHAEANALIFADRHSYQGGTIYITNPCCWDCSKLVANSGLKRVVFFNSEVDNHANIETPTKFLEACGLQVDIEQRKSQ
jgi:deoxycytidylate deaminase